jgi:hypothetical protein
MPAAFLSPNINQALERNPRMLSCPSIHHVFTTITEKQIPTYSHHPNHDIADFPFFLSRCFLLSLKINQALERNPRMPRTRKLLAVPFVGKDVPSRESEFSHPGT